MREITTIKSSRIKAAVITRVIISASILIAKPTTIMDVVKYFTAKL